MTQVFHQFRTRSRALAQGLVLVLLATWLAAVCPHCLAQAAEPPAASGHCHSEAPPPVEHGSDGHASCPTFGAMLCDGGECAQLSAMNTAEPITVVVADGAAQAPLPGASVQDAWPTIPPPVTAAATLVAADPCPLYLRHCSFLN
jgi:hypothetical protein